MPINFDSNSAELQSHENTEDINNRKIKKIINRKWVRKEIKWRANIRKRRTEK